MPDQPHRARRYRRWCRACRRLDETAVLIAGSHGDGERDLRSQPWTCPRCGGADFEVTTTYQDGDLDHVPVPIGALRDLRGVPTNRRPE